MSDTDATTTEPTEQAPEADQAEQVKQEDPRISKANAEAKKYRTELRAAQKRLEELETANLTESEKAIAEAVAKAKQETAEQYAERFVRAEFRAQAAGRVENLDDILDDLNLRKFVGEDGEVDTKAIEKAVSRYAPAQPEEPSRKPGPRPDLSQGSSTNTMALNSDELTEALKAAVGAR